MDLGYDQSLYGSNQGRLLFSLPDSPGSDQRGKHVATLTVTVATLQHPCIESRIDREQARTHRSFESKDARCLVARGNPMSKHRQTQLRDMIQPSQCYRNNNRGEWNE